VKVPKVVVDTNVFVSAVLLKGPSSRVLEKWKEGKFILLFSPDIFDEYFEVLARPKFNQEERDIRELAELLTEKGLAMEPRARLKIVEKDPTDNKFLECAVAGDADFIISGDRHLLNLQEYEGIRILKISRFIWELENDGKNKKRTYL